MKLNVQERFLILNSIPQKGNEEENELMQSIFEKIGFNEEDKERVDLSFENGITWSLEKDGEGKDVSLSIKERGFIIDQFEAMNKDHNIARDIYPVYKQLKEKINE